MIPLSAPNISGNEWKYIKECLDTNWVSSVGSYVTRFEEQVAEFCGVKYGIATANGTSALHINLLLSGVERNDLVLLPNITFVAPANVIKYAGADPVLMDVDEFSWQINLDLVDDFLNKNTVIKNNKCVHRQTQRKISAILPVHVLGNMCDMERLMDLAARFRLVVVEDSTEALGSYYKGKHAGSFGKFGSMSFNGNKIITTGGGGMMLCNDETLAKRAKHITTQAKANPEEYYHDEVGYNYRLVNILAAMGVAQMEQLPSFLLKKKKIRERYDSALTSIHGLQLQRVEGNINPNNWLYTVKLKEQLALRQHLLNKDIEARPFWVPMNQLPAFRKDLYYQVNDISDKVYKQCLSLPCSTNLTEADQEKVIETVFQFYND